MVEDDHDGVHAAFGAMKRLPDEDGLRVQFRFGNYEFEDGSCIQTARSENANIGGWIELTIDEDKNKGFAEEVVNGLRLVQDREQLDENYNTDETSRYAVQVRARSDETSGGWKTERVCCYLNEVSKIEKAARIFDRYFGPEGATVTPAMNLYVEEEY